MINKDNILASVIIPSYNTSGTLEKAVRSALSQMQNMEVIIIDDCSPDDGFAVAQKLEKEDSRVRAFRLEKNGGVSNARNYGFKMAYGKWIAVLDADDWFESGRLENLIKDAESANVQMAADNQYFFDKHANTVVATAFPNKNRKRILDLDVFLAHSNATKHFDFGMLKPIFQADFIRKHLIEYYVPAVHCQDYYILLCFFVAGGKAILNDTPYYSYIQPFGLISKKGQQENRTHYNHHIQKQNNEHFINVLKGKISDKQMAELLRHDREISAMIDFYDLRKALRSKKLKDIFTVILRTNLEFWKMIISKVIATIRNKTLGLTGYIVNY